jgi:hypothetical protein
MKWAVQNPDSPVGRHLVEHCPGYGDWFTRWRELRNRVKSGVNFSTFAMDDIGIRFSTVSKDGGLITDCGNANRIGLRDAAVALAIVTELMCSIATPKEPLA